jgi:uncharacterized protein YpmS
MKLKLKNLSKFNNFNPNSKNIRIRLLDLRFTQLSKILLDKFNLHRIQIGMDQRI